MVRLSAIFVAICMILIAISIGVVLFLGFGLNGTESTLVTIGALTAFALYDAVAKQLRSRSMVGDQIANLSRGTADLAWQVGDLTRQVAELGRRIAIVERKMEHGPERTRAATASNGADIGELGMIVKQLAETVAAHETALVGQQALISELHPAVPEVAPVLAPETADGMEYSALSEPEPEAPADFGVIANPVSNDAMIATVRGILDANRADLYLQPIVTLPQRKVRYYEAFTRLRNEDGNLLQPDDFLEAAESGGLMPRIDQLALMRAAQVVRRLLSKNRDIGLICNISARTLVDAKACQELLQFMELNQELASALSLEFSQSVWRAMGPLEQDTVSALADLGVRFSMDQVGDLRMEPRDLADRGIRLVKVPAKLLLEPASPASFDIHPADLSDLMARYGIGLIAERIETEATVLDLLEYDLRYGQGFLFSPPRPVRAEALAAVAEGEAPPAREDPTSSREAVSARNVLASAVEEIRRTGILPRPAPGGSRA
jgi:cyclic-di-GMP phosphodiesterase TipF (flagellum assembly factor)